jgi:hypothetical protein
VSRNINLFNPALKPQRDWLSARNLAAAAALLLLALGAFALLAGQSVDRLLREAQQTDAQLKEQQSQQAAITKQLAERQPNAAIAADLAHAEALLKARKEVLDTLQNGAIGKTEGFSEILRAFARQSAHGLWLTGLSLSSGGGEMRIDGRVLNAEQLPAYLRRLNGEKAFQGRRFAALEMKGVTELPVPGAAVAGKADPVAATLPAFIEFSLASKEAAERKP